jgi:cysteate synthase
MEKYLLRCPECGRGFPDRYTNACPAGHTALLRATYRKKQLDPRPLPGVFRFSDWLPVQGTLPIDSAPVTYRSEALARELGLANLFIAFSGYWPERGGSILSCSFKELEAVPTVLRLRECGSGGILVVASAGNTARAFAQVSALTGTPVVLVVPERSLYRIWTTVPAERVYLIAVRGDYTDAIEFSLRLTGIPQLVPEGGAKNVARRDGMGTVMLDGAVTIGHMPDHYFQAVGSGTGGIAAWEAALRLREDGRFGIALPKLHLSQSLPFIPMVSAFLERRREIIPDQDMPDTETSIRKVYSDVLTNRNPPYGVRGGTYDALIDTCGEMYAVTCEEAAAAERLFVRLEGIDPDPAASVAVASLLRACETETVGRTETVLLNITGGGYERVKEGFALTRVPVAETVPAGAGIEALQDGLAGWVKCNA